MAKRPSILLFIFIACCFAVVSCTQEFEFNQNRRLLIKHEWKINTFVDYSQNQTTEFRESVYDFRDDNSLIKTYENNDTVVTAWELSADADYITIGSNTFKITGLSNRVLSLRYGDVEMFFVRL